MLVDTSILIDYFRRTDITNPHLVGLVQQGYEYRLSAVTEYEIYRGALLGQISFWNTLLLRIQVLPFDKQRAQVAVAIDAELKRKRKQIAVPDLFIAATALTNDLPLH